MECMPADLKMMRESFLEFCSADEEAYRVVVLILGGYEHNEIAKLTGSTESRICVVLEALRRVLEDDGWKPVLMEMARHAEAEANFYS